MAIRTIQYLKEKFGPKRYPGASDYSDLLDTLSASSDISGKADLSGASFTGYVSLHADPQQAMHAATKEYVDNVATGIVSKPQVLAATTQNLSATYSNGENGVGATLTAVSNGEFPQIDGVSITTVNGQRGVLIKNQTNAAHNGRYNLTVQGSSETKWVLTRCGLCDEASEIPGAYVFVTDGAVNGQTGWVQSVADPISFVVGNDPISVFQFSGSGTYTAGNGLTLTGNQFSADTSILATQSDLSSKQDKVSEVSDTQIGYLGGAFPVTSSIQSQLDGKANLSGGATFSGPVQANIRQTVSNRSSDIALTSGMAGAVQRFTSASNLSITINNVFSIGDRVDILRDSTGEVTIAPGSGVTLVSPGTKRRLNERYSSATVICVASGVYHIIGDLKV